MEGFLPWPWAVFWWLLALPCLAVGVYQLNRVLSEDREALPLLGVTGGFVFILSSLKLPLGPSSSHPTGTGLPAICFGPWITAVISAIVLLFQALFLAHGGLSTLGANIVAMGVAGPLAGWGLYRLLRDTRAGVFLTVFLACALTDMVAYLVTSLQLALAFPAETGGAGSSFVAFAGIFALIQVPIALVEAFVLALVFQYIVQLRPGIFIRLKIFPEEKILAGREGEGSLLPPDPGAEGGKE